MILESSTWSSMVIDVMGKDSITEEEAVVCEGCRPRKDPWKTLTFRGW